MTINVKRLKQFCERPQALHYREIEKILIKIGFEKVSAKGSHVKFKHRDFTRDLIIPVHHHDCDPFYKKLALKFVLEILN